MRAGARGLTAKNNIVTGATTNVGMRLSIRFMPRV
jgi:hypothetical protein